MNTARATSWSVKLGQTYYELVNLIDLMGKEWDNSILEKRIDLLEFIISDVIWEQENPD